MTNPQFDAIRKKAAELSTEENKELVLYILAGTHDPSNQVKECDISQFYGTVEYLVDGVEYQNKVRSEWQI
jgi:hypothetical protein